jgi:hypothetical protein
MSELPSYFDELDRLLLDKDDRVIQLFHRGNLSGIFRKLLGKFGLALG